MTFNFVLNFWRTVDENGSMTWTVSNDEISILYYFNDEKIDVQKILSLHNEFVEAYGLWQHGWKLPFHMQVSNSETWHNDYFKRISVENDLFAFSC